MSSVLRDLSSAAEKSWERLLMAPKGVAPRVEAPVAGRPPEFSVSLQTTRPVAYLCCDGDARETLSGGVLQVGEYVWLQPDTMSSTASRIVAFAESAGLVTLDRRRLGRLT